jgi:outer membrane autotransporter protein
MSGSAGPTGGGSKDSEVVYTPAPDNKWGVFLSGTGEWIDVDGDGNARGYDITTGSFTVGVDYKVTPHFAIGISAGYAGTAAGLTNDGRVWVNGGKLGAYATYFTGGFYTDVAVNGGYNSYDTKRGGLEGAARGSTAGGELNVLLGTGYDFTAGALKIGPTATFNYTHVGLDGFTEHGSLAPLSFPNQSGESLRTAFGFKASYDWKIGGVIVKPELRAAWQHEYADNDYAIDSKFANGAGNVFSVSGPRIGRDSLLLGGGFAVQFNARTSAFLYYDGQIARENYASRSLTGGLCVAF